MWRFTSYVGLVSLGLMLEKKNITSLRASLKSKLSTTMLDDTASISTVDVSDDLAPDPKIFVMSSLRSSVGTSTVLTDDLAPDPFIVPSTQPPATAVVLTDELAPD